MAETVKQLRRRVKSVSNLRKITKAMEMVAAAKLRRASMVLMAGRPYARKMQDLLARLASSASVEGHPLFEQREVKRRTLVVFTSDRAKCGAFNINLIAAAERYAREHGREGLELYCVGTRGHAHFARRGWEICGSAVDFGGTIDSERSNAISSELQQRFLSGESDEIVLLYSKYVSTSRYPPIIERFLSLDSASLSGQDDAGESTTSEAEIDYIFEPSAQSVFGSLLPRYLQSKIYITFAEQFTSEHSARMLAMHNATENCKDLGKELTLKMNQARQSAITKELLDIVGGSEALKA